MALASSSDSFGGASKNSNEKLTTAKTSLDFYESMYHFKKMFPKLDSEVIECILRSNSGQVDKTLDQLLTISMDDELNEMRKNDDEKKTKTDDRSIINDDSPPPYHELMLSSNASQIGTSNDEQTLQPTSLSISDSISGAANHYSIEQTHPSISETIVIQSSLNVNEDSLYPIDIRANWHSRAMIGELRRDFLRIRLTNEQHKKFKSSIKKAKREEIAAIVNNVK